MSNETRATKKAERAAWAARREMLQAEAARVVATGRCPECSQGLHRNLSLTGWWQCDGFGAEGFRKAGATPCSYQTFTA